MRFRAGSSIREYGGTLHPAAQLIGHPLYDWNTFDFNVALVKVSDNLLQTSIFGKTSLNLFQTNSMGQEILFKI